MNYDDGPARRAPIGLAKSGDKAAFELIMGPYVKTLYHYIRLRVGDSRDIQDITQEIMLACWQGLDSFREDSSLSTWIIGIARRKISDFYRRARPELNLIDDDLPAPDGADDLIEALDVRQAVKRLPLPEREMVFLIFSARLSYQEVAETLGIPTGTVKSRMSSVKSKLRSYLETKEE